MILPASIFVTFFFGLKVRIFHQPWQANEGGCRGFFFFISPSHATLLGLEGAAAGLYLTAA
jgi:hypothetical protein